MFHLNSVSLIRNQGKFDLDLDRRRLKKINGRLNEIKQLLNWSPTANGVHQRVQQRLIHMHYNDTYNGIILCFNTGLLAWIFFEKNQLNIIKNIYLDKFLLGKLVSDHVVDFQVDDREILVSYTEPKITIIRFSDDLENRRTYENKGYKLKSNGLTIHVLDLELSSTRRAERHLVKTYGVSGGNLLVWWENGASCVSPWSTPVRSQKDLANLLVYNSIKNNIELCSYGSVTGEIFKICFSNCHSNQIIIVSSDELPHKLLYTIKEITETSGVLQDFFSLSIPLPSRCVKVDISSAQDKLIILLEDRTLMMFNIIENLIYSFQISINAVNIVCNPLDALFVVCDAFGQILMYDYALNVIAANYDDLLLEDCYSDLENVCFLSPEILCFRFSGEAFDLRLINLPYKVDLLNLVNEYLKHDYINEAILNLQSLHWNHNAFLVYQILTIIFNRLLKEPLNPLRESQLEATLATFFSPRFEIEEEVCYEYKLEMRWFAKRFFFHLLRYNCLEKAFCLAIDLKSRHLFLTLHKIAKEKRNDKLAQVSLEKAHQLLEQITEREESSQIISKSPSNFHPKMDCSMVSMEQNNNFGIGAKMPIQLPSHLQVEPVEVEPDQKHTFSSTHKKEALGHFPFKPVASNLINQYTTAVESSVTKSILQTGDLAKAVDSEGMPVYSSPLRHLKNSNVRFSLPPVLPPRRSNSSPSLHPPPLPPKTFYKMSSLNKVEECFPLKEDSPKLPISHQSRIVISPPIVNAVQQTKSFNGSMDALPPLKSCKLLRKNQPLNHVLETSLFYKSPKFTDDFSQKLNLMPEVAVKAKIECIHLGAV